MVSAVAACLIGWLAASKPTRQRTLACTHITLLLAARISQDSATSAPSAAPVNNGATNTGRSGSPANTPEATLAPAEAQLQASLLVSTLICCLVGGPGPSMP
jgi:hypothetical protein